MSLAYITSAYGSKYLQVLPSWIKMIEKIRKEGDDAYIILTSCREYESYKKKSFPHWIHLVHSHGIHEKWGGSDKVRLEKVISLLSSLKYKGVVHVDLDCLLTNSIHPLIDQPYDFIISRAFVYPEFMVKSKGYVACTGFYIAKPKSLPFLKHFQQLMGYKPDQLIIANILHDKVSHKTNDWDVYNLNGIALGIMPKTALLREPPFQNKSQYGYHHPEVINYWKSLSNTEDKDKTKKSSWLWIILGSILLLVIIILVFLLIKKKKCSTLKM